MTDKTTRPEPRQCHLIGAPLITPPTWDFYRFAGLACCDPRCAEVTRNEVIYSSRASNQFIEQPDGRLAALFNSDSGQLHLVRLLSIMKRNRQTRPKTAASKSTR